MDVRTHNVTSGRHQDIRNARVNTLDVVVEDMDRRYELFEHQVPVLRDYIVDRQLPTENMKPVS